MPRGLWPRLRATALLAAVAAGLLGLGKLLLSVRGFAWASEFASIAGFFLALVALIWPWLARQVRGPRPVSTSRIAQAAEELAGALQRQWAEEERVRRVNDPHPLPVRWEVTPMAESAMLGGQRVQAVPGAGGEVSSNLAGEFENILGTFNRVPSRRLVILGPAGAGKSMLAIRLARELLSARQPGMPVPVIVAASAWDPAKGMPGWIADQLVRNHPGLAQKVKDTTGEEARLADLMAASAVLPILDGLDELPDELREQVLTEVNAYGSGQPIVVTSRPDEYLGAVAATGRAIAKAMVVELLPLGIPQVQEYLSEATSAMPEGRWTAVFRRLDEDPGGPLASALTTPLMVWLASVIYRTAGNDPGELVTDLRFADQEAIELHLLDAFLPAIYARGAALSRYSWTPGQARRWLAFLASRADKTQDKDLEWWRLGEAAEGRLPVTYAIRAALLWGVTLGLADWLLRRARWRYAAHAPLSDLNELLRTGPVGRRILPAVSYLLNPIVAAAPARVRSTVHAILSQVPGHQLACMPQLVVWITLAAMVTGVAAVIRADYYLPAALTFSVSDAALRAVTRVAAWIVLILSAMVLGHDHGPGSVSAYVAAFFHLPSAILLLSLGVVVALTLAGIPRSGFVNVSRPMSPTRALRQDRRFQIVPYSLRRAVWTVVAWLCLGPGAALVYGTYAGIRVLSVLTLGSARSSSGRFTDARIWLACTRRMPARSMTFLADAHRRGVLRQSGAVYQFRHIRLQQRLSAQHPRWSWRLAALAVPVIQGRGRRIFFPADMSGGRALLFTAPWTEPIWALLLDKAAARFSLVAPLGTRAGDVRRIGPGFVQQFDGAEHSWVLCVTPDSAPVLVARPVWDALRMAGAGTPSEVYEALGFPTMLSSNAEQQRVIPADAERVDLTGGDWGRGVLVRDRDRDRWHWEPAGSFSSPWLPRARVADEGPLPCQARFRATTQLPWAAPGLTISAEAHEALLGQLPHSDLARVVAGLSAHRGAELPVTRWQPGQEGYPALRARAQCQVTGPDGNAVLAAEASMALRRGAGSTTLATSAEVRIEDLDAWRAALRAAGAPLLEDDELRLSLDEVVGLCTAAWAAAAEILPGVVVADPVAVPPAGRPSAELALSVAARRDGTAGHGLRDFVDFAPFGDPDAPSRWQTARDAELLSDMRVTITGPLRLGYEDRTASSRAALAFMARQYGFRNARRDRAAATPSDQG